MGILAEYVMIESGSPDVSQDVAARSVNVAPFINRTRVKNYILEYCQQSPRSHVRRHMVRVSKQVYIDLNTQVEEWMKRRVDNQPSVGKTVM